MPDEPQNSRIKLTAHSGGTMALGERGDLVTYLGLLRGINVGGHKQVAMAGLRDFLVALGFDEPRTLLQSGNVVFRGRTHAPAQLERLLASEASTRLGLETDFFVRTADEWRAIVARNPFRKEAERDPSHLLVMLLKDAPDAKLMKALQAAITGREVVRAGGRHAYIVYPDGIGRSRLTGALIEKTLGTRGTGRNWNTVLKLGALLQQGAGIKENMGRLCAADATSSGRSRQSSNTDPGS